MPTTFSLSELAEARGVDLGTSDWIEITQDRIDTFADATDDHQWIHTDPERAADGPFGGVIAHGYLTIALLPALLTPMMELPDARMVVNYGIDRLRLTAPVPVGSRVRAHATVKDASGRDDGVMYRVDVRIEVEGEAKPSMKGTVIYVAYA